MATKDTQPSTSVPSEKALLEQKSAEKKSAEKTADKKVRAKAPSEPGKLENARVFFEESRVELKKVTWPTKKEIRVTTFAVLIMVTVMSIFLGTLDLFLVKVVEAITSIGS
ncbi:MAG: preprotein translocase subunit SecE [Deltaproteobacteria bacterium]|jgi:preprotein translocase subunit SecE|nr:preprotein translocase subunit SecE [Deltaproteobacteria bacterium]